MHEARETQGPPEPAVAVPLAALDDLRWADLFGNHDAVEVEIGIGKGGFLLRRARQQPDRNFFGVEWASKYYRYAVDRMQRHGLTNVRIVRTDAEHFIRVLCPRHSLRVLHVYHPDPWPKKRHHKRRLFQPKFVEAAVQCLEPGGLLRVQTDHADYFQVIRGLLLNHAELEPAAFFDPEFGDADGRIETNFEIKYDRQGRTFHRIAVRRKK